MKPLLAAVPLLALRHLQRALRDRPLEAFNSAVGGAKYYDVSSFQCRKRVNHAGHESVHVQSFQGALRKGEKDSRGRQALRRPFLAEGLRDRIELIQVKLELDVLERHAAER